jgi:hypothetical protein
MGGVRKQRVVVLVVMSVVEGTRVRRAMSKTTQVAMRVPGMGRGAMLQVGVGAQLAMAAYVCRYRSWCARTSRRRHYATRSKAGM